VRVDNRNSLLLPIRATVSRAYALRLTSALIAGLFLVTQSFSFDAPATAEELQSTSSESVSQTAPTHQTVRVTAAVETVAPPARDGYTVTAKPKPRPVPPPTSVRSAPAAQTAGLRWPVPAGTRIASSFGPRSSPCSGCSSLHEGVDFSAPSGAPVHAIANGVVVEASKFDSGALGVYVAIKHVIGGQVIVSAYAHLQAGSMNLGVGSQVAIGQVIGQVGNTGASTGTHLHFEIRVGGTTPVDPISWMHARLG
jgi:murein DD-endopeptidase MepM/ murein hydrolase activator NlpD